jgi:predicted O-methyltransferase YrrM
LGRLPADEREWSRRIEAGRRRVASLDGTMTPDEVGVFGIARSVRWMSVPPVLGRLLMRLVRERAPRSCLELGTGFGLSAAYQGAGLELNGAGRLVTIDVDPRPAAVAADLIADLGLDRVEVRAGTDADLLVQALAELEPIEFAFIDADHRGAATVETFELLVARLAPGALLVLDDVAARWEGMTRAWDAIRSRDDVGWSRRLGRLGIVVIGDA